ncbi:hypothetical protein SeMB42_g00468 [Synchytrium endobioticum]|uniref:Uncharacterized protein n=1 Tax=Synchytrium endobioticum TaxID=286115 RepID=A0A507DSX5_9FUNG|nr:hypothetical protein SeLEV6574_g00331 [Synchytrium endobioticum]TPX54058.1 hypothetical protein SeMB42_g00468 [Synchytrium endobioticum]
MSKRHARELYVDALVQTSSSDAGPERQELQELSAEMAQKRGDDVAERLSRAVDDEEDASRTPAPSSVARPQDVSIRTDTDSRGNLESPAVNEHPLDMESSPSNVIGLLVARVRDAEMEVAHLNEELRRLQDRVVMRRTGWRALMDTILSLSKSVALILLVLRFVGFGPSPENICGWLISMAFGFGRKQTLLPILKRTIPASCDEVQPPPNILPPAISSITMPSKSMQPVVLR